MWVLLVQQGRLSEGRDDVDAPVRARAVRHDAIDARIVSGNARVRGAFRQIGALEVVLYIG